MDRDDFEFDDDEAQLESPLQTERFIRAAIEHALSVQEWPAFFSWAQRSLPQFATAAGRDARIDTPDNVRVLAYSFARALWNGIPLPRLNFKPDPIGNPGRNEVCGCGTGIKYKHCCANAPQPPAFATDTTWPLVISRLSAEQLSQAFALRRVPFDAVAEYARDLIADYRATEAVEILSLIKDAAFVRADAESVQVLAVLTLAYFELDRQQDIDDLVDSIIALPTASPLRAHAWLHRASAAFDAEDAEAAWHACNQAKLDAPNTPAVCELEVILLRAEGNKVRAQARAAQHVDRLVKNGVRLDAPEIAYLRDIALGIDPDDIEDDMEEYDLDEYELNDDQVESIEADGDELKTFTASVVEDDEELDEDLARIVDWAEALEDRPLPAKGHEISRGHLRVTDALNALEQRWDAVVPALQSDTDDDSPPYELPYWQSNRAWVDFLEKNDAAFDSVMILSEVASAVLLHSQGDWPTVEEGLTVLWRRAAALTRVAVNTATEPALQSGDPRGAAALECLVNLFAQQRDDFNFVEALDCACLMLALDPEDRFSVRGWLVNCLLLRDENHNALGLALEFPHDHQPAMRFGCLLALLRLNKMDEARRLLRSVRAEFPVVIRYLVADRVEEPADGVHHTDEFDAWRYRKEMRRVWLETPDALDFLSAALDRKNLH